MKTVRLTTAQAIVRYLMAQQTEIDGELRPLFAGAFAIFGHGNVTCLGPALEAVKETFPTWRGQNEQGMALAAVAFAKAMRRRQIMVATSSIGPGATNMVTAAAVAHANRLPVLLLSGDTFASRIPDPVLQQVESFHDPSATVNDSFKPVTRFWDRIVKPEQVVHSLPHAVATMLDPATCGPVFLGLPQDVQAEAYDYPVRFFEPELRVVPPAASRRRAAGPRGRRALRVAASRSSSPAAACTTRWPRMRCAPSPSATTSPSSRRSPARPRWCRPTRSTPGPSARPAARRPTRMAAEADVVLAVGTRLQDFTTGSWTVFANEAVKIIGLNTATFDAVKHLALPLVADAREGLSELDALVGDWRGSDELDRQGPRRDRAVPRVHRQDRQPDRAGAGGRRTRR